MSSGVAVDDQVIDDYNEMHMGKEKGKYRCILFKISDDKKRIETACKIECEPKEKTDKVAKILQQQQEQYEEIVKNTCYFPDDDGRYVVWDFHTRVGTATGEPPKGQTKDSEEGGTLNTKLVFMTWMPDVASIGKKMLYASSKDALKKKLKNIQLAIDCNDKGDLDYKDIMEKISKHR